MFKVDYHDLDFGGNATTVFGEEPLGVVEQNANFAYTDESTRAVLDLKYKFGNGITLSSLSGYQDIESVNNLDLNATISPPAHHIYIFNSHIDAEFYSQEFNLLSPDDQPFTMDARDCSGRNRIPSFHLAGGWIQLHRRSSLPVTSIFPWFTSPWDNEEEDRAVFAHGRYRINGPVGAGGRRPLRRIRKGSVHQLHFRLRRRAADDSLCHTRRRPAKHR